MKYMLMMNAPRSTGDWGVNDWSPEDFKAHIAFMHSFNGDLTAAGERAAAEGLAAPGEAKLVRAGKDGKPVTDGVFPETKEFLAGGTTSIPERNYLIAKAARIASNGA